MIRIPGIADNATRWLPRRGAAWPLVGLTLFIINVSVTHAQSIVYVPDFNLRLTDNPTITSQNLVINLSVPYDNKFTYYIPLYVATEQGSATLEPTPGGLHNLTWYLPDDIFFLEHLQGNDFFIQVLTNAVEYNRFSEQLRSDNPRVLSEWYWDRSNINPSSADLLRAYVYGLTTAFSFAITGLGLRFFNRLGNDFSPEI